MKYCCKYFLLVCIILFFGFSPIYSFAQTDIYGGLISTDTIWTKDASPYVIYAPVEGDVPFTVDTGATLTLEAGTIVKFDYGQSLNVSGSLVANGTANDRVYFTSLYNDAVGGDSDGYPVGDDFYIEPSYFDWEGINILTGGSYDLNNSEISYATNAFTSDGAIGSIENSTIKNIGGDGISIFQSSVLDLTSSNIEDIFGQALGVSNNSSANVVNSDINNVGEGIEVFGGSTIHFENSILSDILFGGWAVFAVFNNSTAYITNSQIQYIIADSLIQLFNNAHVFISESLIKNIDAIAIVAFTSKTSGYATSTLDIASSTISDGTDIGLEIFGKVEANITNTKIQNFLGSGVQAFSNPIIKISESEISGNDNGIESFGANIEIKNSSIFDNIILGIYNVPASSGALVINAINNWWGDVSGPYNELTNATGMANGVTDNVDFDPWLLDLPGAEPICCSNVFFIPGLKASRLYKPDYTGGTERLWEPELFHDNSQLFLDTNGEPIRDDIYTKDIIDNAYIPIKGNIYGSFIASMNQMKSDGVIEDWSSAPYDWRLSLEQILDKGNLYPDGRIYYAGENAATSSPYIINELRRLAANSPTGKVTIIAHSNGGLVTKALTNKLGSEASQLIEQIIFVAVPQAGTPTAVGAILHGFKQGLPKDWLPIFFSPEEALLLGQNMPSAYNLLPTTAYSNYVTEPIITFDNSDFLAAWREIYGDTIFSGQLLHDFLSDQSRSILETKNPLAFPASANQTLLNSAESIHDNELDNWIPPTDVTLTEIAGWGEETLKAIEYVEGWSSICDGVQVGPFCSHYSTIPVLQYNPKITTEGDGTVVVPSALWTASSTNVWKYWVDLKKYGASGLLGSTINREHADILEIPQLRTFIENVLTKNSNPLPQYISTSTPLNTNLESRLHFILHSPLSLSLYDDQGNHTGISTSTGEVEENIPSSRYMTFGEVQYISTPASTTLHLLMNGYESGSFTLTIEQTQGDTIIASTTFAGVPSATGTIVTIDIPVGGNLESISALLVDEDGDGVSDINFLPKINGIVFPDFSPSVDIPISANLPLSGGGGSSYTFSFVSTSTQYIKKDIPVPSIDSPFILNRNIPPSIKKNSEENKNILPSIKKSSEENNDKQIATSTILTHENNDQLAAVGISSVNSKIMLLLGIVLIVIMVVIRII